MSKDTSVSALETYIFLRKFLQKFQNMSFEEQNKILYKFDKKIDYLKGRL